jgi:DNA-binding CsgD family transcriptional regulator
LLAVTTSVQVGIAWSIRDPDGAVGALDRCLAAIRGGEQPIPAQAPYLVCANAWAAMARGDPFRAQRILLEGADSLPVMPLHAARLSYEAMRAGATAGRIAPALRGLEARCDSRLVSAETAHVSARADRDGVALVDASNELEQIGALLYASEAAAHAAETFLQAGRHDSARRAAVRCRELFADGQGATKPQIEGLEGPAVELTAREVQLVELARRGFTNPQIAERLVLSVRTVETHLYRAMRKLGVSDRRDL